MVLMPCFWASWGEPAWRGDQLYTAIYRNRSKDLTRVSNLPGQIRDRLTADYSAARPEVASRFQAADGTMGQILHAYLDWRLSGDSEWLRGLWPGIKKALEFAWVPGPAAPERTRQRYARRRQREAAPQSTPASSPDPERSAK